jgi:hypothetical protein
VLITFSSKNSGSFTMFGDIALQLIKLMGHSGTIPGALAAEDVPRALAQLNSALSSPVIDIPLPNADDANDEQPIGLQQRAAPLIEMLIHAVTANSYVMWDK